MGAKAYQQGPDLTQPHPIRSDQQHIQCDSHEAAADRPAVASLTLPGLWVCLLSAGGQSLWGRLAPCALAAGTP